jgi:hypothetical protein
MKVIVTESQYQRVVSEGFYESEKLYPRDYIVGRLNRSPKYMREYIKNLPHIECTDNQGIQSICTKIPEVVYQFLFGNF